MLAIGGVIMLLGVYKALESAVFIYQYLNLHLQWVP